MFIEMLHIAILHNEYNFHTLKHPVNAVMEDVMVIQS